MEQPKKRINTASKGARWENEILSYAMGHGATFAMRGASSKARQNDEHLKIDCVILKGNVLYFIQAKNHERKASLPERKRYFDALIRNRIVSRYLFVKGAFIEDLDELKQVLKESENYEDKKVSE